MKRSLLPSLVRYPNLFDSVRRPHHLFPNDGSGDNFGFAGNDRASLISVGRNTLFLLRDWRVQPGSMWRIRNVIPVSYRRVD